MGLPLATNSIIVLCGEAARGDWGCLGCLRRQEVLESRGDPCKVTENPSIASTVSEAVEPKHKEKTFVLQIIVFNHTWIMLIIADPTDRLRQLSGQ